MTQKQFFSAVSAQTGIPQVKVSAVILAALDVITDTLEAGDSIMLRGSALLYGQSRDEQVTTTRE